MLSTTYSLFARSFHSLPLSFSLHRKGGGKGKSMDPLPDNEEQWGSGIPCSFPGCNRRFNSASWMSIHQREEHPDTQEISLTLVEGQGDKEEGIDSQHQQDDHQEGREEDHYLLSLDQITDQSQAVKRRRRSMHYTNSSPPPIGMSRPQQAKRERINS